jgi:FkbM family methyltransferase
MEKKIHRKTVAKKIEIKQVCEVGVFLPEMSNILDFIVADLLPTMLVEPDPKCIEAIRNYFGGYENVTVQPVAVYDHHGFLELVQRNASTFVSDLPYSPAQVNDDYQICKEDVFKVPCIRFDEIDNGAIDLLSIDTEGSEWYVLKYLKSRPAVISVETHGKSYVNPFFSEIRVWMETNGYDRWYMDNTDTVYYKKGVFEPSGGEKLQLWVKSLSVGLRRARKKMGL